MAEISVTTQKQAMPLGTKVVKDCSEEIDELEEAERKLERKRSSISTSPINLMNGQHKRSARNLNKGVLLEAPYSKGKHGRRG